MKIFILITILIFSFSTFASSDLNLAKAGPYNNEAGFCYNGKCTNGKNHVPNRCAVVGECVARNVSPLTLDAQSNPENQPTGGSEDTNATQ